jgi:hypothetical protein
MSARALRVHGCLQGNLKPDENRVLAQGTDCFILGPKESMMVMYSYSVVLPDRFFYTHFFGVRTIGVMLTVAATGFDVSSDLGPGPAPVWERPGLSMIGDHFSIRWNPIHKREIVGTNATERAERSSKE